MKIKRTNSFILATIATVIFITLITIFAELLPALKEWLKSMFGHHWIGKGVLSIVLWGIIAFVPVKFVIKPKQFALIMLVNSLLIILFYVIHYFI